MKLSYKKPAKKQYPQVLELILKATKSYETMPAFSGHYTMERLRSNPMKRKYRILVHNDKIVGFASWKIRAGGLAWLSQFYIDPAYQRRGCGQEFLKKIENEASLLSNYMVLEYWPDAPWAKNFFYKNGYKEMPRIFKSKSTYTKVVCKKIRG